MNDSPKPWEGLDEATYTAYVQQKARAAILIELRDFDWMSLDPATARKIHALLPYLRP